MHSQTNFRNPFRRRGMVLLGIVAGSLLLRGDGCIVEQKTVEGLLTLSIGATWHTQGFVEGSSQDSDIFTPSLADLEAVNDALDALDNVDSFGIPAIAGAKYEVVASSGHNARRAGSVSVDGNLLLGFDVPSNAAGTKGSSGDGTVTLEGAGVAYLKNRLTQFLDTRDPALLQVEYTAQWTSTPAPTQASQDDFEWVTDVILQVPVIFKFDGPS